MKEHSSTAVSSQPNQNSRAVYQTPQLEQHHAWHIATGVPQPISLTSGAPGSFWFDGKFWSENDPWSNEQ